MSKRWRDDKNANKFRQIDKRYPLTGGGDGDGSGGSGGSIVAGILIGLLILAGILLKLLVGAVRLIWSAFMSRR